MFKEILVGLLPVPYTFDWPRARHPLPTVDLAARMIGHLAFGDHIDAASDFGRPDAYLPHAGKSCSLLYPRLGLLLRFDRHRHLDQASLFVAPGPALPEGQNWHFCHPVFSSGLELDATTTETEIRQTFGEPCEEHRDDASTELIYEQPGLELAFDFLPAGTLATVRLRAIRP